MLPNLFVIGAPKSGTTSIYHYLATHPDIYACPNKEPGHFCDDLFPNICMDRASYLELFEGADPGKYKYAMEGTTKYLYSRKAVPEILKLNPKAKFIVLLRNPVELVFSLHNHKINEGRETIYDFTEAWNAEKARKNGEKIPYSCWNVCELFYSEWGMLGDQLERLYNTVGDKNQVTVLFFDDLKSDPKSQYSNLLQTLGLQNDQKEAFKIYNQSETAQHHRFKQAVSVLTRIGIKFHLSLRQKYKTFGISSSLLKKSSKNEEKKLQPLEMPADIRKYLVDFYAEDIKKIERITSRDLSHWTDLAAAGS